MPHEHNEHNLYVSLKSFSLLSVSRHSRLFGFCPFNHRSTASLVSNFLSPVTTYQPPHFIPSKFQSQLPVSCFPSPAFADRQCRTPASERLCAAATSLGTLGGSVTTAQPAGSADPGRCLVSRPALRRSGSYFHSPRRPLQPSSRATISAAPSRPPLLVRGAACRRREENYTTTLMDLLYFIRHVRYPHSS